VSRVHRLRGSCGSRLLLVTWIFQFWIVYLVSPLYHQIPQQSTQLFTFYLFLIYLSHLDETCHWFIHRNCFFHNSSPSQFWLLVRTFSIRFVLIPPKWKFFTSSLLKPHLACYAPTTGESIPLELSPNPESPSATPGLVYGERTQHANSPSMYSPEPFVAPCHGLRGSRGSDSGAHGARPEYFNFD